MFELSITANHFQDWDSNVPLSPELFGPSIRLSTEMFTTTLYGVYAKVLAYITSNTLLLENVASNYIRMFVLTTSIWKLSSSSYLYGPLNILLALVRITGVNTIHSPIQKAQTPFKIGKQI